MLLTTALLHLHTQVALLDGVDVGTCGKCVQTVIMGMAFAPDSQWFAVQEEL